MSESQASPPAGPPAEPARQTYRLPRSGEKDLQFEGVLIGRATKTAEFPDRSLVVELYATTSGRYVTRIEQGPVQLPGREVPGGFGLEAAARAGVHDTPEQAYQWLLSANRGRLGRVTKDAWVQACRSWPPLHGHDVEVI